MTHLEMQRIKEQQRLYRIKLQTVTIVVIGKFKFPADLFTPEEIEKVRMRHHSPKCYKEYLQIAKKNEPHIYDGNYASTLNEFGMQSNQDPPTITYYA